MPNWGDYCAISTSYRISRAITRPKSPNFTERAAGGRSAHGLSATAGSETDIRTGGRRSRCRRNGSDEREPFAGRNGEGSTPIRLPSPKGKAGRSTGIDPPAPNYAVAPERLPAPPRGASSSHPFDGGIRISPRPSASAIIRLAFSHRRSPREGSPTLLHWASTPGSLASASAAA